MIIIFIFVYIGPTLFILSRNQFRRKIVTNVLNILLMNF